MASRMTALSASKVKKGNTLGKFLNRQDRMDNAAPRQPVSARAAPVATAPEPNSLTRGRPQLSKVALEHLEKNSSAVPKPTEGLKTLKVQCKEICGASDISTMADSNDAVSSRRPRRIVATGALAHDQHVVPVLPTDRPVEHGTRAAQREASVRSLERKELDSSLLPMVGLCGGAPSGSAGVNAAKRSATPARPMRTAFTDRTLRLREGAQSRTAFGSGAPLDLSTSFKTGHENCNCPTCKPFELRAAGQFSTLFAKNVLPNCHQSPLDMLGKAADSATYNSEGVGNLMSSAPQGDEQASLQKSMGRKMRHMRSHSCDPSPIAGQYHKSGFLTEADGANLDRRLRASQSTSSQARSQGAMTIAPRPDDPPPSPRITASKKGFVDPCSVISEEATRQSVRWNQVLYRFELKAADALSCKTRSQSVPPERNVNPITWEGNEDQAFSISDGQYTSKALKEQSCSSGALRAMNFEVVAQEQREERKMRLSQEPRFADLCAVTENHAQTASLTCSTNRLRYGNASRGVSSSLCWQ